MELLDSVSFPQKVDAGEAIGTISSEHSREKFKK
jgi:hypothetical protein